MKFKASASQRHRGVHQKLRINAPHYKHTAYFLQHFHYLQLNSMKLTEQPKQTDLCLRCRNKDNFKVVYKDILLLKITSLASQTTATVHFFLSVYHLQQINEIWDHVESTKTFEINLKSCSQQFNSWFLRRAAVHWPGFIGRKCTTCVLTVVVSYLWVIIINTTVFKFMCLVLKSDFLVKLLACKLAQNERRKLQWWKSLIIWSYI